MPAVKIPANINNAAGNSGLYNPIFTVSYFVSGLPAAVTAVPLFTMPCPATYVGQSASILTAGASGSITISPKKFGVGAAVAPVALNTTDAAFASTAVVTNGPAGTLTINKEGVSTTAHTGATGITDAVLKTDGSIVFAAGDQVVLTTSGTFTSAAGLNVTLFFRDDSGSI